MAKPLTGPNLAQGMAALVVDGGAPVEFGNVTTISDTLKKLQAGQGINVIGASGSLDFDLSTGEAPSDIQIWCLRQGLDKKAEKGINSGIYLDAASMALQGTSYSADCQFDVP